MKRLSLAIGLVVLMILPMAASDAADGEAGAEVPAEPTWKIQARKQLKAYPEAEDGMVRYVLYLEPKADESRFKVELIVGKVVETDGVNQVGFGGQIEEQVVQGWGYTKYVVAKDAFDNMFSTQIGVPPGQPKVKAFVKLGGETMLRYNSKLPVVVYVPAGSEVRYRIWEAPPQATAVMPG